MEAKEKNAQIDIEVLSSKMVAEDNRNIKMMKRFNIFYWVLIPFYFLFFIVNPDKDIEWQNRITGLCYILAFFSFYLIFRHYIKEYSNVDYSLPTTEMLRKAIARYKLFQLKTVFILIPLILIDIGVSVSGFRFVDIADQLTRIVYIQAIFWPMILVAFFVGVLIWRQRQKPLRDRAIQLLDELTREG